MKNDKTIYLFDTRSDEISVPSNTLFPEFAEDAKSNYDLGLKRFKIGDFAGAILYFNFCNTQDILFQKAYDQKILIYLELNQFDNAILNMLKSAIIDQKIKHVDPKYDIVKDYFLNAEKNKRLKIRQYISYYSQILSKTNSYEIVVDMLIAQQIFSLPKKELEPNDYCKFLMLKEK